MEHLRLSFQEGWVPAEPFGPEHIELAVRWVDTDWATQTMKAGAVVGPPPR